MRLPGGAAVQAPVGQMGSLHSSSGRREVTDCFQPGNGPVRFVGSKGLSGFAWDDGSGAAEWIPEVTGGHSVVLVGAQGVLRKGGGSEHEVTWMDGSGSTSHKTW